jgi:hypothetical protein
MNADVVTTRVADGIAVVALGSAMKRENITSPSRSIVVEARSVNHD